MCFVIVQLIKKNVCVIECFVPCLQQCSRFSTSSHWLKIYSLFYSALLFPALSAQLFFSADQIFSLAQFCELCSAAAHRGSSVGRASTPCTEAVSTLQRPRVRFHPLALCCMSFPLSPQFPVQSFSSPINKGAKSPKISLKKVRFCFTPVFLQVGQSREAS